MIRELQLDHLNIVEMMATSADFRSIDYYKPILNKVFDTYFTIESTTPTVGGIPKNLVNKNFVDYGNKLVSKLNLIEQVHRELYKVNENTIKNREFYEKPSAARRRKKKLAILRNKYNTID